MLGFMIGAIILFFILVGAMGSIFKPKEIAINPNSILRINLSQPIAEKTSGNFRNLFDFGSGKMKVNLGLNDILANIRRAETDNNIKGIIIVGGISTNTLATLDEIRKAIIHFKKSGKFVVAYAEGWSQKSYFCASVADKVFMNPTGLFEWRGLSAQITFYKHLFEKIGVDIQVIYEGKFKTATEPFRLDHMSEQNKQMTMELLDSIEHYMVNAVAESRKLSFDEVQSCAHDMLIREAPEAVQRKFVDDLQYWDGVASYLRKKTGAKPELLDIDQYDLTPGKLKDVDIDAPKIAVIYAQGDIIDGEGDDDQIGSDALSELFRKVRDDDDVKAVVFRINSPGGSANASDVIGREVKITNSVKPVVVSMGAYAASGGYYVSAPAAYIFAEPTTLTGSIGVFGMLPNLQKLLNEKLGLNFDGVKTGKYADLGDISRPLSEDEKALIQHNIDLTYLEFKTVVSDGRKISVDSVEVLAQGRVYTGNRALQLGLVDEIGTVEAAVKKAASLAKLSTYRTADYPQPDEWFPLLRQLLADKKESIIRQELGMEYPTYQSLRSLMKMNGIQAHMGGVVSVE